MCMINKLLNRNDNENCKNCEQAKQAYLEFSSKLQNENEKINEKHYIDIHKATCWIFILSLLSAYVSVIMFFISLSLNFARL